MLKVIMKIIRGIYFHLRGICKFICKSLFLYNLKQSSFLLYFKYTSSFYLLLLFIHFNMIELKYKLSSFLLFILDER